MLQEPSLKTRIKLSQLTRKDTQEFQLKNNVTVYIKTYHCKTILERYEQMGMGSVVS